jgi:hypothetical protein
MRLAENWSKKSTRNVRCYSVTFNFGSSSSRKTINPAAEDDVDRKGEAVELVIAPKGEGVQGESIAIEPKRQKNFFG